MTPQQLAEAVRDVMWAEDRASRALGMFVIAVGPGTAQSIMTVRADMLNGHDICHGGLVAMFADSTLAYACNAYNEVTVASGFDISLLAAAHLGDELTASCVEVSKAGRTGVYDVTVTNQRSERIALFRGRSHTMKGKPVVEGLPLGRAGAARAPG